jgi:hypothetical protein
MSFMRMPSRTALLGLSLILITSCPFKLAQESSAAPPADTSRGRRVERFDSGWKFSLGDVANGQSAALDDNQWRQLDLPHDWSIEQPFDAKLASGTGFLPGGIGWYRKTFTLNDRAPNQHISVRFDGVYMNAHVWINEHDLGLRPNGFVPVEYDLTPYLQTGDKPNVLAVRVDHTQYDDSRFYTGSGIYRDVWLITTDDVSIEPWGVYATTPTITPDSATVRAETLVSNKADRASTITLVSQIVPIDGGTVVAHSESTMALVPHESFRFIQQMDVAHPQLWSPDQPNLYQLVSSVKVGETTVDQITTPIGVRSITFDLDRGFFLNGKKTIIKGVCVHQDAGCFGAAVTEDVLARRLKELKEVGCNAIRTSHNPPPPAMLDLCDRMGFLVMDEAFDEWARPKKKWVAGTNKGEPSLHGYSEYFADWGKRDVQAMVQRDRNHPSIILWSIGNEIDYSHDPYYDPTAAGYTVTTTRPSAAELPPIAKMLAAAVKAIDQTRPVTAALATVSVSNKTGLPEELDVVGYNYQEQRYPDDHAAHPKRTLFGSENFHSYAAWQPILDLPYANGQFLWTAFDYIGESGGWPVHGSWSGLIDESGFNKPLFYFRQALWSDKPMVYLASRRAQTGARPTTRPGRRGGAMLEPTWEAPASPTTTMDGVCYTNCDRVELSLNGKSIDTASRSDIVDGVLSWGGITFAPGTLKAVGYMGTNAVCSCELTTAGPAHQLKLTPEQTTIAADGRSLAFIRVDVVDEAGHLVYRAEPEIQFQVTGAGKLRALDTGDLSNQESFASNHRRASHGECLLVVQGGADAGTISIQATADGLAAGTAEIACERK